MGVTNAEIIHPILPERIVDLLQQAPKSEHPNTSRGTATVYGVASILELYYKEPWRHYHTMKHVGSFLDALDQMDENVPLSAYVAGIFHDVIYLPGYNRNEEMSAVFASEWLTKLGVDQGFINRVTALIDSTVHDGSPPRSMAEAYVRDADLWTLGDPDIDRFTAIQHDIRAEYWNGSEDDFKRGRTALFKKMFPLGTIYWTERGKEREAQARENLRTQGIYL